ncbi:MAG: riboflavin biosynthesis protein RibF [Planctomycetaceae bacterium]|nr:riboflavin biosynthesis protein RibF [Planctomycetaceae bacterium]
MLSFDFVPDSARNGCISIGNFDGVHRGHRIMLDSLVVLARQVRTHTVAVTFHPHPVAVLRPDFAPPILTDIPERIRLLKQAGMDHVVVLPVTSELMAMSARQFFDSFVVNQLQARGMTEGVNFRFGRNRLAGTSELQQMCDAADIRLQLTDIVTTESFEISSSRIRKLLVHGQIAEACTLLGHPYTISGVVSAGAGRGTGIGFPTANLERIPTLVPSAGVYAGLTTINGTNYVVAVHIGPNPTFADGRHKVECHIDQFTGSLYGTELSVQLIAEVRTLQSFASPAELVAQIEVDVQSCRRIVSPYL